MIAIVCVDNGGGMLFNSRRVSRDRAVYLDIAENLRGHTLYMAEYSRSLFSDCKISAMISDGFLEMAGGGEYCFVENRALASYADRLEGMVIYRWNRDYPKDFLLDVAPEKLGLTLRETSDFKGNSHEKITKEIYVK